MPIVNVKLIENVFDADQKKELIAKVTDVIESIYPGLRDVTFVTIDETKEEHWGIGGTPLTSKMVEMHAKKALGS